MYVVLDINAERCKRLRHRVLDHLSTLAAGKSANGDVVRPSAESFDAASPYHAPAEHGSLWVKLMVVASGVGGAAAAAGEVEETEAAAAAAATAATATWKPLVETVAADWALVRYINSCYPVKKSGGGDGSSTVTFGEGNEKELLKAITKELSATPGVGALRLQVKHKQGDQGLLQRIGTALHAGGVKFHPKKYTHMLSVVYVSGDGFAEGGELLYGVCSREVIEPFLAASRADQEDTSVCRAAFKVKEGLSKVSHASLAAAAAAAAAANSGGDGGGGGGGGGEGAPGGEEGDGTNEEKATTTATTTTTTPSTTVTALDLGAAPGGWTAQLAGLGYSVIAIDPAKLDPTITALQGVRHLAMRVNEALPIMVQEGVKASLCTCDMNFDAREAARAVASVRLCLVDGADLILTIKLPEKCGANQVQKQVLESTAILKEAGFAEFEVVHQMTNTPWERTVTAKYVAASEQ